jgi:transcriptional regulator with XRE-family HTH domain
MGCPIEPKTLGDHIRRRRLDLGLVQRTVAKTLRVRQETVGLWENGLARPLPCHYGRIVQFLGYDPEPAGSDLPERVRARRRAQGLTQAELAARLGTDEGTIVDLEHGRRRISRRVNALAKAFVEDRDGSA